MGSCYSSAAKRRSSEDDDQVTEPSSATRVEEEEEEATAAVTASGVSPKKQKQKQRHGSGRWRKKGGGTGAMDEAELHRISGRMVNSGASKTSCLYTQQGKKGTNQDAMIVWENFNSRSDTIFCGIFDGHGPYGHMVAKKVRDCLPLILCSQWKANSAGDQSGLGQNGNAPENTVSEDATSLSMDDECYESLEIEENEELPQMYLPLKKSILKAFKLMDKELKLHPTIDCFCSGTTAVTFIKKGQDLVIGNVGDSRAVLAVRDKDNSLVARQLTIDLKPDLPREAARIQDCKGRVFALQDEPEVARVWLPNNDSPGLAMARAFGDFCLKDFGLISVPDIFYRRLTERDEFIILATDGVWDVLSNKEAVDIVASAPSRATAARAIIDCATRAWRLKYPTSKNDDCAVVCLFLEHLSVSNGSVEGNDMKATQAVSAERTVVNDETNGDSCAVGLEHAGTLHENDMKAAYKESFKRTAINKEHSEEFYADSLELGGSDEIVPISEPTADILSGKGPGHSKRSLAECISVGDDDEWSALEGITRANSLLSLPRFLSGDKISASWRKVVMKHAA